MNIKSSFIDEEDIVSKLHLIEYLEKISPYPQSGGRPYFERIKDALKTIPEEYHKYALALFANVIYLNNPLLRDTWEYLLNESARVLGINDVKDVINESMFFELDVRGVLYEFINKNQIGGRLDRDLFPRTQSIEQLIEKMILLASSDDELVNEAPKEEIASICKKRYWVLLVDNSLSGTSICSELRRLFQIAEMLKEKATVEKLLLLIQVLTEDAKQVIEKAMTDAVVKTELVYSLYFDSGFKIVPEGMQNCKLFAKQGTVEGILSLCQWFSNQDFFINDERYSITKKISEDDLCFGFKTGGWTIVTPNCPTNSIPLLWYSNPIYYKAPFKRIDSRLNQVKGQGQERLELLIAKKENLLNKL